MLIDSSSIMSISEANQNFSRVARQVDARGSVVILRNNKPRYVVFDYELVDSEVAESETVAEATRRILAKHKAAFEALAK
ncbi:MAG: type II toxin-antitoxin system Phd/YefM family antitoxin [Micrococcales bacterium]|nr:type II toxin-antitoxin system Phd/YefM family antitoxin [Micrococcales bacterium]